MLSFYYKKNLEREGNGKCTMLFVAVFAFVCLSLLMLTLTEKFARVGLGFSFFTFFF
jgi:hypothetical protein